MQRRPVKIVAADAHELMHAEVADRLGFWTRLIRMPVWFDEGIAMQLDARWPYRIDCAAAGRQRIVGRYQAAKCAAAQVLARHPPATLYGALTRLCSGESFYDVFVAEADRIECDFVHSMPESATLAMSKTTVLLLSLGAAAAAIAAATTQPAQAQSTAAAAAKAGTARPASCPAVLHHTFKRLQDEAPQDLCQYAGKVILVVNTASYCGYTKQYEGLEALYAKYAAHGLVVLGFPSNDFNQEDADAKKIADLCYNTFGVKFPMFATTVVKGKDANPLYGELARSTGNEPKWNFNKYLIDRNGKVLDYFPSKVTPEDPALVGKIEQAIKG